MGEIEKEKQKITPILKKVRWFYIWVVYLYSSDLVKKNEKWNSFFFLEAEKCGEKIP